MTPTEEWQPVVGWEGAYEVSDLGRVASLKRGRDLLRPGNVGGYATYVFYRAGRPHGARAHVLVAEAFIGPRPDGCRLVRHLDGDQLNNTPANLAWGTDRDNAADRVRHGTTPKGEAHGLSKLTAEAVLDMRRRYAAGESLASIHRGYPHVVRTAVVNVCKGRTWQHVPMCQ